MRGTFPILLCACGLVAWTPAAQAQDDFLVEFNFDTLWFRFHPNGLGSATPNAGSGIEVFAQNIHVVGEEAKEVRHCIDGHSPPACPVDGLHDIGNRNGQAEADEIERFRILAPLGLDDFERVATLQDMLSAQNLTVDGMTGIEPRVMTLAVRNAEDDVNATTELQLDVTVHVDYANDKGAKRHEIRVLNFDLGDQAFTYADARWTLVTDQRWEYKPAETQPEGARSKTNAQGWTGTQSDFETLSEQTLLLVVEKKGKGGSPGLELVGVAAAALLAVLGRRRA